jgi:hypothetical protein
MSILLQALFLLRNGDKCSSKTFINVEEEEKTLMSQVSNVISQAHSARPQFPSFPLKQPSELHQYPVSAVRESSKLSYVDHIQPDV